MAMILSTNLSWACSICGGGMMSAGSSALSNVQGNFISLGFDHSRFQGSEENGIDNDAFSFATLSCQYHVADRIKLTALLPYQSNVRTWNEGEQESISGLSDVRLMAGYRLINRLVNDEKQNLIVELMSGLQLPTGDYDGRIYNKDLPMNFNIGKGGVGYIVQSNVALQTEKAGAVFTGSMLTFSKSSNDYRFGHFLSAQSTYYRSYAVNEKMAFEPMVALRFDSYGKDHFANGREVADSGSQQAELSVGLTFKYNKIAISFQWSQSVYTSLNQNLSTPSNRVASQFIYNF